MLSSQARALALCGAILVVIVSGVTATALPSADHLGPATKRAANSAREILPEGWSFFTKSPRDAFVVAYNDDGEKVGTAPNAQPKWAFGLNRASRLGGIDVDRVMQKLGGDAWHRCDVGESVPECSKGLVPVAFRITDQMHSLCGSITLARMNPTPWAFRGTDSPIEKVATVNVKCS